MLPRLGGKMQVEIRTKLEENLETRRRHGGAKERERVFPICISHGCQEISPHVPYFLLSERDLTIEIQEK